MLQLVKGSHYKTYTWFGVLNTEADSSLINTLDC